MAGMRDPLSIEEIEWTLWCTTLCRCENCKVMQDFPEVDHLLDEAPMDWAKAVAPVIHSKGWSAPGEFELLCPSCTAKALR